MEGLKLKVVKFSKDRLIVEIPKTCREIYPKGTFVKLFKEKEKKKLRGIL